MPLHPFAHSPDLTNVSVAQRPFTFGLIAEINDSAGLLQQAFRRVIRQLGQGLGTRDADANWNSRVLENGRSYLSAKSGQVAGKSC